MYCGELGRNWLSVRCFAIRMTPSARLGNPRKHRPDERAREFYARPVKNIGQSVAHHGPESPGLTAPAHLIGLGRVSFHLHPFKKNAIP